MNEEILLRNDGTLTNVDVKQRIIEVLAMPWEQETDKVVWRGETWREVISRNAFDGIEPSAGRISVNRQHEKGAVVGKVVAIDTKNPRGMLAQLKIARTPLGDETLQLAEEDMIGPSVGYYVKRPSDVEVNHRTHLRRVNRAFVDHIAMVDDPAFVGARVLAVREGSRLAAVENPLPKTPNLDELLNDDVFAWARQRVSGVKK